MSWTIGQIIFFSLQTGMQERMKSTLSFWMCFYACPSMPKYRKSWDVTPDCLMGLKLANKESLGYLHQCKRVSITSSVFHNILRQSNCRIYVDKQSLLNYWRVILKFYMETCIQEKKKLTLPFHIGVVMLPKIFPNMGKVLRGGSKLSLGLGIIENSIVWNFRSFASS